MLSACILNSGFLASYWSAGSSGIDPCLPLAGGLCKFYANEGGKQPLQRQILLVQYEQQANPILLTHNYTQFVISRNNKNKQLTNIKPT
jgi:hypothetical protein